MMRMTTNSMMTMVMTTWTKTSSLTSWNTYQFSAVGNPLMLTRRLTNVSIVIVLVVGRVRP